MRWVRAGLGEALVMAKERGRHDDEKRSLRRIPTLNKPSIDPQFEGYLRTIEDYEETAQGLASQLA